MIATPHPDVRFFNGNVDAFRFVEMVSFLSHFWDDLVDRDKPVDEDRVNAMMTMALVDLPRNLFYRTHFAELSTLLATGAMHYRVSRVFEQRAGEHGLELAHHLRYNVAQVATYAAMLCGASPELIAELQLRSRPERIADYLKEQHAQA